MRISVSQTPSNTPSNTPTNTPTGTVCPGLTPTVTPSVSVTPSPTQTINFTPTQTQTQTQTPTPTKTRGLTPTPTQTQTSTPTSTFECLCFSSVTVNVFEEGNITFNDCNGNPTIENFIVGNGQIYGDGTFCIQKDTNGGTAMYTIVSYNDCCTVPPPTSTPTPTATPTSTIGLTPTQTSTPTRTQTTPTPTSTPTATPQNCLCFSTTYETIPSGLQVRYRNCSTGNITTVDISTLLTRDNLDGTYTSFICVTQGSSYATPVCVLGGIEVTCDPLIWVSGGACSDSIDCDIV